jgi:hypothetical protein
MRAHTRTADLIGSLNVIMAATMAAEQGDLCAELILTCRIADHAFSHYYAGLSSIRLHYLNAEIASSLPP